MDIYFSSDWHYGHQNIVRGCSKWDDTAACRNFNTLEEHNAVLVENINKVVKEDDIIYFLGDWSFGGIDNILKFRRLLSVRNIHFIGGNHDHHIRGNRALKREDEGGNLIGYVNAHNVFASYNEVLERDIGGQKMVLCHYAMRTWHKANHGSWMLYGHSHGELPDYIPNPWRGALSLEGGVSSPEIAKTMDVGIDTHPEFRPYHFDEVKEIMKNRINLGHHHEQ